jgi:PAS domain S-box-containing protein
MTTNISPIQDRQFVHGAIPLENESQELAGVLQKIVQNAGALLEVGSCSLALSDTKGTALITLAALQKNGQKPRHTRFELNEGVADWVAEHRTPLIINDVSLDIRFKPLGSTPIGSMLCVPLIDNGNFMGTLTASSPNINAFSSRQLQMLTIFAEHAVLAITNARHAELAQHQANQLEMLLDLSRGVTTHLDANALYHTILTDLRRLVPCQSAVIYKYEAGTQELFATAELMEKAADAAYDEEEGELTVKTKNLQHQKVNMHNNTSVVAWAAVHRHPILHASGKPVTDDGREEQAALNPSEMAIPLISKHVLYGVIVLQRAEAFTSDELRIVRNLSNMAAVALENVELFYRVRADQEQLRAILASSSDGIAIVGVNRCFIEANTAFGRIFGIEPEQVVGMECMELLGCEINQPLPYIELDLEIKGIPRSIGLSITPIAAANKPLSLVIARDVTAIRDATRMKANFLSMITHELRSPLNAINGYLDLALTGIAGNLNEQQQEFVQRARASSEHVYALVEDLLLISRADSGQMHLNKNVANLHDIVANAVEELELMAKDNGITLQVKVANDFPPIYVDAVRIQQVLRNLLSNALRFTPTGGQVTIAASATESTGEHQTHHAVTSPDADESRWLKIEVIDSGSGIAPEYQTRIFERFYQAPQATSGRIGGQGLGLAIVKMIVELHGGEVTVASAPGAGSTFTCLLPCLLS